MQTSNSQENPSEHPSNKLKNILGKFKQNKRLQIITAVVVVLLLLGLVYLWANKSDDKPKNTQNKNTTSQTQNQNTNNTQNMDPFLAQNGQGCKDRDVTFSSAPMRMEDLKIIRPLGAMSDGHVTPTDHVYIGANNRNAADNTYPVLMPADGTVVNVAAMPAEYIGDRSGQKVAPEDHRIVISHSCRYFSIMIHIHKLGDTLAQAVGTLEPNQSVNANVELKAGDIIGYIGDTTFDWTPVDVKTKLSFITPSLYEGESWKIHTVSPFDLYKGTLKTQLEAKSLRTVAPIGGQIAYDKAGKLIGNWFREGSGGYSGTNNNGGRYWDSHLSVVPDYVDTTSTVLSIGNWTNDQAKQFTVAGDVNPAAVTADTGMVKYEVQQMNYTSAAGGQWDQLSKDAKLDKNTPIQGTVLLQVLPGEKLKVEKFPGKRASQISGFTSAAQVYYR
jgi:hypothetical protein